MSEHPAGSGYFIATENKGAAILLLHSWWGLTPWVRERADALADAGCSVLVPDLLSGALPETSAEAEVLLADADMNRMADLVLSSVNAIRSLAAKPRDPAAILGWGMGASWALWASARLGESVDAVVAYYGTTDVDFDDSRSAYQLHLAGDDEIVSNDEIAHTRALLGLAGRTVDVHTYDGAHHGFAEPVGESYDEAAAEIAWQRTSDFIAAYKTVDWSEH